MQVRIAAVLASTLFAACASSDPSTEVQVQRVERRADGVPYFATGTLGRVEAAVVDTEALAPVLPGIASLFGVGPADLAPQRIARDGLGMTHVAYEQQRDNLRVVGGEIVVHVGADGVIRSVNGTARGDLPSSSPALDGDTAAAMVIAGADSGMTVLGSDLVFVISTSDDQAYLAWEIALGTADGVLDRVYVDAQRGDIVDRRPEMYTARNRTIFDAKGGTAPLARGTQVGSETMPPTADPIALAAFTNTGITYDCYQELFQRDSYDGKGATLKSLVHIKFPAGQGGATTGNNAAWALNQMMYGDGDGQFMAPLAQSLDVTAHELTHGVTSATANLAYMNESGALNEGMSDIMAAVCEAWHDGAVSADTWQIGEDIFTPSMAGDALRYMANPTADKALYPPALGGSRDFYPERYTGGEDQGGVHLNSGIPNLAFQLLVAGGTHPRMKTTFPVPGVGMEKAGAVFQRALTSGYFTMNTNLAQARTVTEQVADELYPGMKTVVGLAWAAVGVGAAPEADGVPPTVEIVSPADGAYVPMGFPVDVTAADDKGVVRVELAVDGQVVGTLFAPPYTFTTDAALTSGHTITATAYDVYNQATDSVTIDVRTACTTDDQCEGGDTCASGVCQPDGGGCCSSSDAQPTAAWLGLAVLFLLRRRRR